jgi:multiple sugar transport system substrate-binding protein
MAFTHQTRRVSKTLRVFIYVFWGLMLLFILPACQVMGEPPRLATATAQAALPPTATPEPLVLSLADGTTPVPLPVAPAPAAPNRPLVVWVNETSPEHETAVRAIAAAFSEAEGVDVELRFVASSLLPKLVETAVSTDTHKLADVIIHPLEYSIGWSERGILDPAAATASLESLGRGSFDAAALELVQVDGGIAALPSDGFHQILLYRQDWFAERDLATPDHYAAIIAAAEATYDRENLRSGFVIPTESNLLTTHQAFEHLAIANDCQLVDEAGEVLFLSPACGEAVNFYYDIVHQFSPIGVQTDTSARNAYLEGRTGIIMASPRVLPMIAGLNEAHRPTCPECLADPNFLATNTGIITTIRGQGETAVSYGVLTNLGITVGADTETAVAFAEHWFNEGYETWLAVEPERKVPMRLGTAAEPTRFIATWGTQPLVGSSQSLSDIFGPGVVTDLREGVAGSPRWAFREGWGGMITTLAEDLTVSIVLQEMLSGYFDVDKTIVEMYNRVLDALPGGENAAPDPEPASAP